jgi:hypothetical protein
VGETADRFAWLCRLGREQTWDLELLEEFVRIYLLANGRRQRAAREALPGIEHEAATWSVLRSRLRFN